MVIGMSLVARPVDPRDVTVEKSEPTYRVYFWEGHVPLSYASVQQPLRGLVQEFEDCVAIGRSRLTKRQTVRHSRSTVVRGRWMRSLLSARRTLKRPADDAERRIVRRSCSKSASWSPKRCGAVDDVDSTHAATSSIDRSTTRPSGTTTDSSGANPAARKISSSPLGEVFRKPWPARRSGPNHCTRSASMASSGTGGNGPPGRASRGCRCHRSTWTTAPPGSSMPRATAATRARSIQWNDCANVMTRKLPRSSGSCSARSCTHAALTASASAAACRASLNISASESTPTTCSKSGANSSVTLPGPQPTSRRHPRPSRCKRRAKTSARSGAYGYRPCR